MTRDELLKRLADADIAFAEVNSMDDLAQHPHLRRIDVKTPNGVVSYPAPAAIVVGEPRHYGAVPAIGEQPAALSRETFHADQGLMSEKPDLDHLRQWIGRSDRSLRHRHRATGEGIARHAVSCPSASRRPATPRPSPCTGVWRRRWFRLPSLAPTVTRRAADSCRRCRCHGGCGRAANWNSSTPYASAMR